LELPAGANGAKVAANMKDGVLEIRVPKLEPEKRNEVKIEIHWTLREREEQAA
jgi:HSP20 family molecular chaperone IbpA